MASMAELREKLLTYAEGITVEVALCVDHDLAQAVTAAQERFDTATAAAVTARDKAAVADDTSYGGVPAAVRAQVEDTEGDEEAAAAALAAAEASAAAATVTIRFRRLSADESTAMEAAYPDMTERLAEIAAASYLRTVGPDGGDLEVEWDQVRESALSEGDLATIYGRLTETNLGVVIHPR